MQYKYDTHGWYVETTTETGPYITSLVPQSTEQPVEGQLHPRFYEIEWRMEPYVAPVVQVPNVAPISVSPVEFKLLFTAEERIALRQARVADLVLQDFFDIAEDPHLTKVELTLPSTIAALDYMVSKGFLTEERAAEIKLGQRP